MADQTFYVDDSAGPLMTGETERAAAWAHHLVERLSTRTSPAAMP
jgi:hypothetical protein